MRIERAIEGGLQMIAAGDFKNGVTVEIDGNIYQILEFQHQKDRNRSYSLLPK